VVRMLSRLEGNGPVLLVLDDLHLADHASLQLVHHLARVSAGHPWLIVATCREEDVLEGGEFDRLRTELARC